MINKFVRLFKINTALSFIMMTSTVIISMCSYNNMKNIMDDREKFMNEERGLDVGDKNK